MNWNSEITEDEIVGKIMLDEVSTLLCGMNNSMM